MKFEEYRIAEGIKTSISKLGYKKPTDIQFKSIPPILKGEDVLPTRITTWSMNGSKSSAKKRSPVCSP